MVRNQSRDSRDSSISTINHDDRLNGSFNIPIKIREIQTPTNIPGRAPVHRAHPPALKNAGLLNPRVNNMMNGSVNRDILNEKLAEVAGGNPDNFRKFRANNYVDGSLSSTSPRANRRQIKDLYLTNDILNDSLHNDGRSTGNNTINHGNTVRSTPKDNSRN